MQPKFAPANHGPGTRRSLLAGGLAALLASACCLGPLVLLAVGFSGAWIANLSLLAPYRPIFIAAALLALGFAWRRIWRPVAGCQPGDVCAIPSVRRAYQVLFAVVGALVLVALTFPYAAPWFY